MKKFLIVIVGMLFLVSCNNNKGKAKGGGIFGGLGEANKERNKDDYNSNKNDRNKDDRNRDNNNRNMNQGSWSMADENAFLRECKAQMPDQVEIANQICPCVLQKLEKEFTDLNDLDARGTEEEGRRLAQQCVASNNLDRNDNNGNRNDDNRNNAGGWTRDEREKFVSDCASAAEANGLTQAKAQSYCSCMEEKIERIYPTAADANKITTADMNTPDMKSMAKDCMASDN